MLEVLDPILGVFFKLTGNEGFNVMFGIFSVATLISLMIVLITARVMDPKEMKRLKKRVAAYQEKIKEARKKQNIKQVTKLQKQMMADQKQMMTKSFKPMLYTMIPIIIIFSWLRQYEYLQAFVANHGYVVKLPFTMPEALVKNRTDLGWFGWYIFCSLPTSTLIKKILNIEGS